RLTHAPFLVLRGADGIQRPPWRKTPPTDSRQHRLLGDRTLGGTKPAAGNRRVSRLPCWSRWGPGRWQTGRGSAAVWGADPSAECRRQKPEREAKHRGTKGEREDIYSFNQINGINEIKMTTIL
uniref:Uncharacterized protein n=1 Tax=Oryzias latipes TaxID=8090 RepID=A0A3P9HTT9_ORYLA